MQTQAQAQAPRFGVALLTILLLAPDGVARQPAQRAPAIPATPPVPTGTAPPTRPAAITSVTPNTVSAGNEITVLIKAPSAPGRAVTLSVFALDHDASADTKAKTLAAPPQAATVQPAPVQAARSAAWYTTSLADNDRDDLEVRPGLIMVKIPTNASWGPPPGLRAVRRYGLIVNERVDATVPTPTLVGLDALRQVRVVLGAEISAHRDIQDSLARIGDSALVLKDISGDEDKWKKWEGIVERLARDCDRPCFARYGGLLFGSSALAHAKRSSSKATAWKAFDMVTDTVHADYADVVGAIKLLPPDQQKPFYDDLKMLDDNFKLIHDAQAAHASTIRRDPPPDDEPDAKAEGASKSAASKAASKEGVAKERATKEGVTKASAPKAAAGPPDR